MSQIGKSANTKYFLNLDQGDGPIELKDIKVLATFDNRNVQANISTDKFTFTGEQAQELLQQIADGLTGGIGIYERPPYEIQAYNNINTISVFKGFLDTPKIEDLTEEIPKIRMNLVKEDGLNVFNERLEGLTYGRLEDEGTITNSDYQTLEYVIERKGQGIEIVIITITLFLMTKTLIEQIRNTSDQLAELGRAIGNTPFNLGDILYNIALAIINIAYIAALIITIIDLITKIIKILLPPIRKHKVISYRKLLEKAVTSLGYTFESPIADLDTYFNLPSNEQLDDVDLLTGLFTQLKGTPSGIPRPSDDGYLCSEFFNRCKLMFNAEIAIINGVVHFRSLNDIWWIKNSTYTMPDVIRPIKKYNSNELIESRLINFQTDITDEWTVENFQGTNYEITTKPIIVSNQKAVAITGFERIQFNVALGERKDKLNALENTLLVLAGLADQLISALFGASNFANSIKTKIGVLKISQNNYAIPKILKIENEKIPVNHRDLLSAKYLYNEYINENSFVANNFGNQKTLYEKVKIPFGLEDFLKVISNSFFTNFDGKIGKFTKLEWNIDGDSATADFYIEEIHSKNLKEEFLEVE